MASPLSATRYNRPYSYEDRTPRYSPPTAYESNPYLQPYDNDWTTHDTYAHPSNYDGHNYDSNGCHRRSWHEENYQPMKWVDKVPNTNYYQRSFPPSRLETHSSTSNHTKNLDRYQAYHEQTPLSERNKWSEQFSPRPKKTGSPSRYCSSNRRNSVFYNRNYESSKAKFRNKRPDHLRESRYNDQNKDSGYETQSDGVEKERSPEIVSERDSSKAPKQQKHNITCLICSEEVKRGDIHGHLLFGFVKCTNCPWSTNNCKDFIERRKSRFQCNHSRLQWSFSTVEKMVQTRNGRTKESLKDYLASTIALKYYAPHDSAYNHCHALVEKMPDDGDEGIPEEIDVDFAERCVNATSSAETDTTATVKESLEDKCNNSDESPNAALENLEKLLTFHQSPQPHVLLDEIASEEANFELVSSRRIPSETVLKTNAKKEYLESSTFLRMPKKKKTAKVVSVKNKHSTLIIGDSSVAVKKGAVKKETKKASVEKEIHSKDRDILPSFVTDNYVITYTLSDDCPQCYAPLNPNTFTVYLKSHILIAQCEGCSLFVCIRNKQIDSLKETLTET